MRKCSTLVIKDMQIKITMKHHCTPSGMAKTDTTKSYWGWGAGLIGKWRQGVFCGPGDVVYPDRDLAYAGVYS